MADRYWVGGTGSWDGTTTHWSTSSGGANGATAPGPTDNAFFDANSVGGTATINAAATCLTLDFTGYTGTLAGASTLAISGALTLGAAMGRTYTGAITFNDTSGTTRNVTSNGITLASNVTFDGAGGGVWSLVDTFVTTGAINLTRGTFTSNSQNITAGSFVIGSGTATRVCTLSNTTLTLTGTGIVWDATTATGLTFTGGSTFVMRVTNASASTKTVLPNAALTYGDLYWTGAGTGSLTVNGGTWQDWFIQNTGGATLTVAGAALSLRNVDFTGFTGSLGASTQNFGCSGNWTFGAGMTCAYTGITTFNATSGTKSITSNGVAFSMPVHFNGSGGTWQLADTFSSTSTVSVDVGTFTTNNQNLTCTQFIGNFAGTKSITFDNSTVTLTGTGGILNIASAALTFSAVGSTLKATNASAALRTIQPGNALLGVVQVTAGTGTVQFGLFSCTDLDFTGFTGDWGATLSGTNAIYGNLTCGAGMTTSSGGGAGISFLATSGTKLITSNGVTIAKTINFGGVGGTWQLVDAMVTTNLIIHTNGTFDSNGKAVTCTTFMSNGSQVRTLTLTNTTLRVTGSGTCFNLNPFTNGTLNVAGSNLVVDNSADNLTRTVTTATGVVMNDVQFVGTGTGAFVAQTFSARDVSVQSATATSFRGCSVVRTLDFTGYTGAWDGTNAILVNGNLKLVPAMSIAGGFVSPLTFNDTTGAARTITSAGKILTCNVTVNGVGQVLGLVDAFHITGSFTLTNGSFTTNGQAVQCAIMIGSNANVRTLDITGSTWTLAPTVVVTAWNLGTTTGLTFVATGSRIVFAGTAAGNIVFTPGALTYNDVEFAGSVASTWVWSGAAPTVRDIFVTNNGAGTWLQVVNPVCRNVDFTGFNGTWSGTNGFRFTGNITLSALMTNLNTGLNTAQATSGTQTITSNGITFLGILIVDAPGATVQLADAYVSTGANWRLQNGTFDTQNQDFTVYAVILGLAGSGVRAMNLGSSLVTLTGVGGVWNSVPQPAGLTINAGTSEIVMNDSSASDKFFNGNGFTFYDVTCAGTGTGEFEFQGSSTYHKIEVDTPPHTVRFLGGTTQTLDEFVAQGSAGNENTFKSANPGFQAILSKYSENVSQVDYGHFQDLRMQGGARWFLGAHSVNDGNTNGGRFCGASNRASPGAGSSAYLL